MNHPLKFSLIANKFITPPKDPQKILICITIIKTSLSLHNREYLMKPYPEVTPEKSTSSKEVKYQKQRIGLVECHPIVRRAMIGYMTLDQNFRG